MSVVAAAVAEELQCRVSASGHFGRNPGECAQASEVRVAVADTCIGFQRRIQGDQTRRRVRETFIEVLGEAGPTP
jgi:hypothetical protein